MSQETPKLRINYFAYVNAWLAYLGKIFTAASQVGDVVRNSFTSIAIPKKEDYVNKG